ncbi:MAG: tetratricopeptide repeat protein, partial [Planctomycetes bacterium]|nr:tetratricopeptide repeat protein [Planctomycetota bacterium]
FRRFPEAHGTLDEGLRRSPPLVSGVLWLKGLAHVQKDELREALRQLQLAAAALEREGNQGGEERGQAPVFPLNLAMGRCAIETGDLEGARAAIERAAQASPSSWEPSYWRGRIALAAGDPDGALQSFDDAARRGGRDLMDLGYYGALALARKGQVREALGRLKQVVERSPGFQLAYESFLGLARDDPVEAARVESVLAELKAIRAELAAREKAVAAKPLEECGADYLEMAKLALRLKEPGAYNWLFLASDLLPESAEAAKLLVAGMKQPQDLFVRVHFLRRLLVIEPEGEGVLGALAEVYVKLHVRLEEARRLAERLHARRPSALSHRLLGKALALLGDREKGLEVLRSGLAAFPGDKDLAEALAEASGTGSAGKDGG